jgi:hypothetical protein
VARVQTPQLRRIVAAQRLATALEKAAAAAHELIKIRVECGDDPRVSQIDDNMVRLRNEMRELGAWLEQAAPTWPTGSSS